MDNKLLNELKGKIVTITYFEPYKNRIVSNMFRLLDFDDSFVKIQDWGHEIFYRPFSSFIEIFYDDKDDYGEKKFLRYEENYKLDKDFEPDDEPEEDKGLHIIKKKEKVIKI